jgi:dihydroorotase
MLVDNPEILEEIFSKVKMPICVHCEDETTIRKNTEIYKEKYGEDIPVKFHHLIRSEEACYLSSSKAVELAKKLEQDCIFIIFHSQRNRTFQK